MDGSEEGREAKNLQLQFVRVSSNLVVISSIYMLDVLHTYIPYRRIVHKHITIVNLKQMSIYKYLVFEP
jgi:hypothetical protein